MHIRLKREVCKHTKHDSVFSKWEILIGSNDWEDHASGKEGAERYRIHNLPNSSSCPGLYELGVASIPTANGHRLRKLYPDNIIVVYLGQADNIRTRLQEYGRSGSHLDQDNLSICRKNDGNSTGGPGLFKDIFSRGFSIMFRWAPIKNKREAEKTEMELLYIFDYAWNRRGNGVCRHADILPKLNHNSQNPVHSPMAKLRHWKEEVFGKRAGINIDTVIPHFEEETLPNGLKGYLLPRIFKVSSTQLRFLPGDGKSAAADQIICGVATGHGSICLNRPVPGRRRCTEHKGKKITGVLSASRRLAGELLLAHGSKTPKFSHAEEENGICGVNVDGHGSICLNCPVPGRRRCTEHKGKKITGVPSASGRLAGELLLVHGSKTPKFSHAEEENGICGVVNVDGHGSICLNRPVPGRRRCTEHKGKKITGIPSAPGRLTGELLLVHGSKTPKFSHAEEENGIICGVVNVDGCVCRRRPVLGRKRCEEHKGKRLSAGIFGVVSDNVYASSRIPVSGRGRGVKSTRG